MKKNSKNGFTLVELLAVIVILAIILVIAVPKVMSIIEDSKRATLENTVKMIASAAEKAKIQNAVLGNDEAITCESITNINDVDYASCYIRFDNNTAQVTITGSGKFEGLNVCKGTKTTSVSTTEECLTAFEIDDWATIIAAVQSGNHPYQVGNTKTVDMGSLGTHILRVANITSCSEEWIEDEEKSKTACGFVLEFADIITTHEMNGDPVNFTGDTNTGGWPTSEMRAYLNDLDSTTDEDGVIYNALPEELRNGIINTYVVSSYGYYKTTGVIENENAGVLESELYWSNDKLYLLSVQEVWGTSYTSGYDKSYGTTRQLDYYEDYQGDGYTGVSITNYDGAIKYNGSSASYWWLRSAPSNTHATFYFVGKRGQVTGDTSYYSTGVSPAFRLTD